MGRIYACASTSRELSAPKKVRMGRSKKMMHTQAGTASTTAPMRAAEKYWFSLPAPVSPPRRMLKRTLPPAPMSRPRL